MDCKVDGFQISLLSGNERKTEGPDKGEVNRRGTRRNMTNIHIKIITNKKL